MRPVAELARIEEQVELIREQAALSTGLYQDPFVCFGYLYVLLVVRDTAAAVVVTLASLAFAYFVFGRLQGAITEPLARMTRVARDVMERRDWTSDKSVDDGVGHGTFVAGMATAIPDNGIGIAATVRGLSILPGTVTGEMSP